MLLRCALVEVQMCAGGRESSFVLCEIGGILGAVSDWRYPSCCVRYEAERAPSSEPKIQGLFSQALAQTADTASAAIFSSTMCVQCAP
jgi:hypothetical protein